MTKQNKYKLTIDGEVRYFDNRETICNFLEIKPSNNSGIPEDHMAYNSDFLEIKPTKNLNNI